MYNFCITIALGLGAATVLPPFVMSEPKVRGVLLGACRIREMGVPTGEVGGIVWYDGVLLSNLVWMGRPVDVDPDQKSLQRQFWFVEQKIS